ncbi:hypothetical protein [Nocardia carnea]|uniref:hypothetical protein n=1 Tax=Nocardia carnea TaxID=37328 RepID=UPI0024577822|nr:hypothetical protein [Nocardia carnea]
MAFAVNAAHRGYAVTLFDAAPVLGGQFDIARRVPGKDEVCRNIALFHRRTGQGGSGTPVGNYRHHTDSSR